MIIGVPREIKTEEYRVAMTPDGVRELKRDGHTLLIEEGAGLGSGFGDEEYLDAHADVADREAVFRQADLIVKVKEPLKPEFGLLRQGGAIFTYLHLAPNRDLTEILLQKKIAGLAYETLEQDGLLPLLAPMSEIAGRMAPLAGCHYLERIHGGAGVLPTGAVGVRPAKIVILGAGVVGANAARVAFGIGMEVVVLNRGVERLRRIDELFLGRVNTAPLTAAQISAEIRDADIAVGAVLVPGGRTPVLITRDMLGTMKKGAVIVDVSIDQGGCVETSRPTTHDKPVYEVDGIIHYSVANMPGAYPRTATLGLTNATLPFIRKIAGKGIGQALKEDRAIRSSLNTYKGRVVHPVLAESLGVPAADLGGLLGED